MCRNSGRVKEIILMPTSADILHTYNSNEVPLINHSIVIFRFRFTFIVQYDIFHLSVQQTAEISATACTYLAMNEA